MSSEILDSPFEERYKKHSVVLQRFIEFLDFNGYNYRVYSIEKNSVIIRSMEQYLDHEDQDIRYTQDINIYSKGRWGKFEVKSSYWPNKKSVSIELASIEHARRHNIVCVTEISDDSSSFYYLYPREYSLSWDTILVPKWRWTPQDKELIEQTFPTKQIHWCTPQPLKGSGTPFVLAKIASFSDKIKLILKQTRKQKQAGLEGFL